MTDDSTKDPSGFTKQWVAVNKKGDRRVCILERLEYRIIQAYPFDWGTHRPSPVIVYPSKESHPVPPDQGLFLLPEVA